MSEVEQKRFIRADQAQVLLLDHIATMLRKLGEDQRLTAEKTRLTEEILRSMIPEGIVEPLKTITVTDEPVVVEPPFLINGKRWFSVKISNDGPNTVNAIINTGKSGNTPRPILMDETYTVEFKTAIIRDVYLYCASGETASLRISGVR